MYFMTLSPLRHCPLPRLMHINCTVERCIKQGFAILRHILTNVLVEAGGVK